MSSICQAVVFKNIVNGYNTSYSPLNMVDNGQLLVNGIIVIRFVLNSILRLLNTDSRS